MLGFATHTLLGIFACGLFVYLMFVLTRPDRF
jgi:K+-transporting ATPase KdpF subunit